MANFSNCYGFYNDVIDGGNYRIDGTIDELGVLGQYRVRLFDRSSGRILRATWSDESGIYAFELIAMRTEGYFIVGHDRGDEPLNAAIADLVTPELML